MTRKKDNRTTRLPVPRGELPEFTPVPRLCNRHDGWTKDRQRAFIEALADTGSVAAAARAVNMSPEGAYHLRRQQGAESFRKAWEAALDLGVQKIEDVAMDRALNGMDVPVYSYGKLVGKRTVYNDRLLMFMLRNRAGGRFTEGKAKALNAVDKAAVKKLKKEWRKEWEREAAIAQGARSKHAGKRLEEKLERMHQAHLTAMSPRTRAAYDRYQQLREQDAAEGYQWWHDPEHPEYQRAAANADAEDEATYEARALPPPGWTKGEPKVEEEEEPRVRRLKDEGWE